MKKALVSIKHLVGLFVLVVSVLTGLGASASGDSRDTLRSPPWPFPYAEECPVDWPSLAGRYYLQTTRGGYDSYEEFIELKVSILYLPGRSLVHVARYGENGQLLSRGFSELISGQRVIMTKLIPTDHSKPILEASVKLHYISHIRRCSADTLVPILSLTDSSHQEVQYRLVPVENN